MHLVLVLKFMLKWDSYFIFINKVCLDCLNCNVNCLPGIVSILCILLLESLFRFFDLFNSCCFSGDNSGIGDEGDNRRIGDEVDNRRFGDEGTNHVLGTRLDNTHTRVPHFI